jgi:hypothetical protein
MQYSFRSPKIFRLIPLGHFPIHLPVSYFSSIHALDGTLLIFFADSLDSVFIDDREQNDEKRKQADQIKKRLFLARIIDYAEQDTAHALNEKSQREEQKKPVARRLPKAQEEQAGDKTGKRNSAEHHVINHCLLRIPYKTI